MKIFITLTALLSCEAVKAPSLICPQSWQLLKRKVVSFTKKLFLLSLVVLITWPGLFQFGEHDLELHLAHASFFFQC